MATRTDKQAKILAKIGAKPASQGKLARAKAVVMGKTSTGEFKKVENNPYSVLVKRPLYEPLKFWKQKKVFQYLVDTPINAQDAIDVIRGKLPTKVVGDAIIFLDLPQTAVLEGLRIPASSYHRKLNENLLLSSEETERVMRLAEVTRSASEAFGSASNAASWMGAANKALSGMTPLSLLDTDAGASQVRRVLSVINYGGVL